MYKIDVLVENSVLTNCFSYLHDSALLLYTRVKIQFNGKLIVGLVMRCSSDISSDYKLKRIIEVIDNNPILNSEMIKLADYMEESYLCSKMKIIQTILPSSLRPQSNSFKPVKTVFVKLLENKPQNTDKRKNALEYLSENILVKRSCFNKLFPGVCAYFLKNGIIELIEHDKVSGFDLVEQSEDLNLTDKQTQVYEQLVNQNNYGVNLLYGVTGSGKSEIYLQLSKYWLNQGKQVLILVPEIGLTPQMINLFISRLQDKVAIYHSKLSHQERHYQYLRVKNNEAKVVVGTRSAVFLPFNDLGCIVIDEEHDDSYKQDNMPKYHTREIADWRSKYHNCGLLLASATPTLESTARAIQKKYNLLTLDSRVNGEFPNIELVDMSKEVRKGNLVISEVLRNEIKKSLDNNNQVMILLNRRGYTPISKCVDCQEVIQCDNCDVAMVYHKDEFVLKCHTCGSIKRIPKICPNCGSSNFISLGIGTQKLEEQIQQLFPSSKIMRVDRDTTGKKNAHQEMYRKFAAGDADILVGTQMISKGLDFSNVSLVGILNADYLLNRMDYRAQETTFSLLTQASGRAGRAMDKSKVIIQAYQIDHYALQEVKKHNYVGFFKKEMEFRKLAGYPPYQYLILVSLSGKNLDKITKKMTELKEDLKNKGINVLGVSQLLKRNNNETVRITLKGKELDLMRNTLRECLENYSKDKFVVDVNPQHTEV